MDLKLLIRDVPDFPKKGILFRDISPLLRSPEALRYLAKALVEKTDLSQIDLFAGIESRGFLLAMLLSSTYQKGFLPIRKAGKLPPPTVRQKYDLEFGQAELEVAPGQGRVMIVDDVLATGGTLQAAVHVCSTAGFEVQDVSVLINLKSLNQFRFRGQEIHSLIQY